MDLKIGEMIKNQEKAKLFGSMQQQDFVDVIWKNLLSLIKKLFFLQNGEINETYLVSLCDEFAYENGESFYRGNEYDDGELSEEEQEEMYYDECQGHWGLEPDGCL